MSETAPSEFEERVCRTEAFAKSHPGHYRFRVLLYALPGYLFIVLLKTKLVFVILPLIWVLMKALWVRIEPPAGYRLDLKQFPGLNREIELLHTPLKSVNVHRVILTPEFNAAVLQPPRLGILGWHRNTLILGLELLLTLSPEQARAVLAMNSATVGQPQPFQSTSTAPTTPSPKPVTSKNSPNKSSRPAFGLPEGWTYSPR